MATHNPMVGSTPGVLLKSQINRKLALWLVWLVYAFLVIAMFGAWLDGIWHIVYEFDDFFSPPHLVIYLFSTLATFTVMGMVFYSPVRRAVGHGLHIKILPFPVSGALVLLGSGLGLLGFAGLILDNFWHTNFGLDETAWSLPHSMLGWMLLLIALGLLSVRIKLNTHKQMNAMATIMLTLMVIIFSKGTFLGPLNDNFTYETVQLATLAPALATQEDFLHTLRIYQEWNLNRTSPLLLLLAPLWFGAVITFVKQVDKRWWMVLILMTLIFLMDSKKDDLEALLPFIPTIMDSRANYASIPIFLPTLLILILPRLKLRENWVYLIAGLLLNLQIFNIWGANGLSFIVAILAFPLILIGKQIGVYAYDVISQPDSLPKVRSLILAMLCMTIITGCVDLLLRLVTP